MQGDEGRTGGSAENGAEPGRGQTEAHHAAGTLIDRGWLIHHQTLNISPQILCLCGLWGK
jgi:hypothetical protein